MIGTVVCYHVVKAARKIFHHVIHHAPRVGRRVIHHAIHHIHPVVVATTVCVYTPMAPLPKWTPPDMGLPGWPIPPASAFLPGPMERLLTTPQPLDTGEAPRAPVSEPEPGMLLAMAGAVASLVWLRRRVRQ